MTDLKRELFEHLKSHLADDDEVVIRSVPFKKEWQKGLDDMDLADKVAEEAINRKKSKKNKFWSMIEEDLDFFGSMRLNREKGEIDIYGDPKDAPVKSISIKDKPTRQ